MFKFHGHSKEAGMGMVFVQKHTNTAVNKWKEFWASKKNEVNDELNEPDSPIAEQAKEAESIFDADVRKEMRQSGDIARWAPAGGLVTGAGAFGYGAGKMMGNYRPGFLKNLSKATALSVLPAVGVWAGAKYQTYKRDKYVASLPEGNKFKRLYTKNRQGNKLNPTDDKKIKDWNKAYNLHVVEPKKYPLTKEQKYITEVMMGTPVKKIF